MKSEDELRDIYNQVKNDMSPDNIDNKIKNIDWIRTTSDFFKWRDQVKEANGNCKEARNQEVEEKIRGNATLELFYDWTKFYRIIDSSRSALFMEKERLREGRIYSEEALQKVTINTKLPLVHYLNENGKGDRESLFAMKQIIDYGFHCHEFPNFNTEFEFAKIITEEEEDKPLVGIFLISYLRAFGVSGEDLIECGRAIEAETNKIIQDLRNGTYPFPNHTEPHQKKFGSLYK